MSGSNELYHRLRNPNSVVIDGSGPLGGWEDAYMINGAHRECHPDFRATPIGNNPNGFLVCQRKKEHAQPHQKSEQKVQKSQSFDLYNSEPNSKPRNTYLGGQSLAFDDRRFPNQAHLQGADYYRDAIKFRAIGIEKINAKPGEFGYQENKYYFSSPPPRYDITHAIQPYPIWRREQIRMGTFTEEQMLEFEKRHTYCRTSSTF